MSRHWGKLSLLPLVGFASAAAAQDERQAGDGRTIIVLAPGGGFDSDDALALSSKDITRAGTADLLGALARTVPGLTLQDAQNNPWQPNLVYRGFVASPLQGQSQGFAVYLDGARFNQPFGDTVPFELIPEAAIRKLSVLDASPIYGLNALGGAILLETKTGASDPGLEASLTGGQFGYAEGSIAGGFANDGLSGFAAFQYSHDGGWRDFSPSSLYNFYADFGFDSDRGGIHLKLVGADTNLTGNGVSPIELLAAKRSAVFTWPDNSLSRYGRISLHPWLALSETTRIEGSLYAQRLTLRTLNGDAADIEGCEGAGAVGLLCLEAIGDDDEDDGDDEEEAILTNAAGISIADTLGGEGYGVLNRGRTRTDAIGALLQLIDERPLPTGNNRLAIGVSYDRSRTRFDTSTELGALTDERSVEGLGDIIVQADGAIAPVGLIAQTDYWGLFIQDKLPLAPGLSAELGLRYNYARVVLEDQIGTTLNGRHSFRRLNPGVELDYEITPNLTIRAGYAESNRAPTPAELSCADENAPCSLSNFFIADPPLEQVVAKSWEAGASGTFDTDGWTGGWSLSAYRTRNSNDIQYIASEIRGRAYFQNIGATRRQGVEASLRAERGGFSAGISYAFTDATFGHGLALSSPSNPEADDEGIINVEPGDHLPGIPRHSGTLTLDYTGNFKAGRDWSIGGDLIARSGQYLTGDEANLTPKVPGYLIANLRAGIDLIQGVTLFGEIRNLFDRKYASFGAFSEVDEIELNEAPDASNPRAYGPGAPRRWYAGVRTRF